MWWSLCTGLACKPMVLLFLVAVVLTLCKRMASWLSNDAQINPIHLQQTITVVSVVAPGESLDPYVRMLHGATHPSRVSLRLFKMLQPQESVDETAFGASRSALRVSKRYGVFDPASERMRLLRQGVGSEFVLLLGGPMEAAAGWDEALVRMLQQSTSGRSTSGGRTTAGQSAVAFLTTVPPLAQVSSDTTGRFLGVQKDGTVAARPYAATPSAPQPSLVASSRLLFGPSAFLVKYAPSAGVNAANEDMVLTKALWLNGANFYAPHVSLLHSLPTAAPTVQKRLTQEWQPAGTTLRTTREWAHFVGKKSSGTFSRRAQLGLTPAATHEERYSKYGDALQLHGIA